MSYSYVKTVFPNFEYSNVYDDKLYKNLNGLTLASPTVQQKPASKDISSEIKPYEPQGDSFLTNELKPEASETRLLEKFESSTIKKDNLHYYNLPSIPINKIEGFSETTVNTNPTSHEQYIKHLSECNVCKEIMLKQFNIESERLRNEEIIELISYIMFGLFILILIDSLKKQ
jgi:hypothetical protein